MASFSAELRVAGRCYSLLRCDYGTHQATDARGRVITKVRYSRIRLLLDVPRERFLATWAADKAKRCAVDIVYRNADGGQASETLHLAGAYCVYHEPVFRAGDTGTGSYVLHLELSDPDGWSWQPGGPGAYVPPAAREHGVPPKPVALVALPPTAAQALLAKQQRYNKRLSLLSRARARLAESAALPTATTPLAAATDATHVASSAAPLHLVEQRRAQEATERLARNNVAVERARLSAHVYRSQEQPPCPEPIGWHMLNPQELARKGISPDMLNDPESGFKAAVYQSAFERPPKLVVSYAGTEDAPDWATNFKQGVGLETKQYSSAMKVAQLATQNSQKGTVDLTGHSLGGGLASAGVAVTGAKGYTFNAAGLHPATVGRSPYSITPEKMLNRGQLIDAYHSTADPLTNLQSGLGALQSPGTLGGLTAGVLPVGTQALGIPYDLVPAEGWQHEWKELVRHNPLSTSTNMALEGHGIDPEIEDHLEAQKEEDTATLTKYVGSAP